MILTKSTETCPFCKSALTQSIAGIKGFYGCNGNVDHYYSISTEGELVETIRGRFEGLCFAIFYNQNYTLIWNHDKYHANFTSTKVNIKKAIEFNFNSIEDLVNKMNMYMLFS
jgi:hypothetical protein